MCLFDLFSLMNTLHFIAKRSLQISAALNIYSHVHLILHYHFLTGHSLIFDRFARSLDLAVFQEGQVAGNLAGLP